MYVIVALPPATFACPISTPSSLNITIPSFRGFPNSSLIVVFTLRSCVVLGVFTSIDSMITSRLTTSIVLVSVFASYRLFCFYC